MKSPRIIQNNAFKKDLTNVYHCHIKFGLDLSKIWNDTFDKGMTKQTLRCRIHMTTSANSLRQLYLTLPFDCGELNSAVIARSSWSKWQSPSMQSLSSDHQKLKPSKIKEWTPFAKAPTSSIHLIDEWNKPILESSNSTYHQFAVPNRNIDDGGSPSILPIALAKCSEAHTQ